MKLFAFICLVGLWYYIWRSSLQLASWQIILIILDLWHFYINAHLNWHLNV